MDANRFFPPLLPSAAREVLLDTLQQSPVPSDMPRMRWRLQDLAQQVSWLRSVSHGGIWRLLHRLGVRYKRALSFLRSPDPAYETKWHTILDAFWQAVFHPEHTVLLFLDELTYYRRPSKAQAWHRQGHTQPRARTMPGANTRTRIVAALNGVTGQVHYLQRSVIGKAALTTFYTQLRTTYPDVQTLYLVEDNWPTHQTTEVLAAAAQHHLRVLFLPTYASWLNPIEKLWRWLRETVLHLHPYADQLAILRQHVLTFLNQFAQPSPALLRYVGLSSD